jgi:hypothetical protein
MSGGFVRPGYLTVRELMDKATAALHGEWAIEPLEAIPGVPMGDKDGNPTGLAFIQGGRETSIAENHAIWNPIREALLHALRTGKLTSHTQDDGKRIQKESWQSDNGYYLEYALWNDGLIHPRHPTKAGQLVEVEEQAASDWLRAFLMSQGGATEPAADPSSLDAFKEPYWTLYECIAWIMARDVDIVNQVYRGTGFDSLDVTIACTFALKEDGKTDVSVDSQSAIDDLLRAARLGAIQVLGAKNGRGDLEPVPATAFHAARFNTDKRDVSLEPRGHDQERTIWGRLTFNRDEILAHWHGTQDTKTEPAAVPTKSGRGRKSLYPGASEYVESFLTRILSANGREFFEQRNLSSILNLIVNDKQMRKSLLQFYDDKDAKGASLPARMPSDSVIRNWIKNWSKGKGVLIGSEKKYKPGT